MYLSSKQTHRVNKLVEGKRQHRLRRLAVWNLVWPEEMMGIISEMCIHAVWFNLRDLVRRFLQLDHLLVAKEAAVVHHLKCFLRVAVLADVGFCRRRKTLGQSALILTEDYSHK